MLIYVPAAAVFLLFCIRVVRERRRVGNAVLLGLSLVLALAGSLLILARRRPELAWNIFVVLAAVVALGVVVLACFLLVNGVGMVRREGFGLGNLLSLLAGAGLMTVLTLVGAAVVGRGPALVSAAVVVSVVAGYAGFLFLCFLGYAFVYGRLPLNRKADFVVVLGSGLTGGSTVPPLLAHRLERGRAVYEGISGRGGRPVLVVSGGRGSDEELPESHAMAAYLVERGFPSASVVREDRSASTEENLRFSREIMEEACPGYRCVIVTSDYHVFRAAVTARREGVRGNVVGSRTAAYFWPSAAIREFVALCVTYWRTNAAVCVVLLLGGVVVYLLR
ncbi:YdcF family protein [Streptomyces sp. NPDC101237]|uniref:YdcF family protein n=1 Tax=Streptomyces sp. NPDC101237 TaxID=3366139 RepID=UPI003806B92B